MWQGKVEGGYDYKKRYKMQRIKQHSQFAWLIDGTILKKKIESTLD